MKKLIVTGAANGIGRATVELAIQQGYFVIGVKVEPTFIPIKTPVCVPLDLVAA